MEYSHRQISKGTIVYKMVSYASNGAKINLKSGDIPLSVDPNTHLLWILEKQAVR